MSKYIQLSYSKEWVPRVPAINSARIVHSEFSMMPTTTEQLARLSAVLRSDDIDLADKVYLNDRLRKELFNREYLNNNIGSLAMRLTLKAKIVRDMVEPDIYEDEVAGFLVEPFVSKQILSELYAHRRSGM